MRSERQLLRRDAVPVGDRADGAAGHAGGHHPGRDVVDDHAARSDDRAPADGDAAADHRVGADPDVFLQRDGRRRADALCALGRIHRVARAGQADARRDEGPRPDVDGRGVQDDAVVVDDRETVGVDVEAVIAVEGWLDEGQVGTIPQQLLEDFPAAFRLIGRQLVVGPAQPLGFGLPPGRKVTVLPRIALGAFENIQLIHALLLLPFKFPGQAGCLGHRTGKPLKRR